MLLQEHLPNADEAKVSNFFITKSKCKNNNIFKQFPVFYWLEPKTTPLAEPILWCWAGQMHKQMRTVYTFW